MDIGYFGYNVGAFDNPGFIKFVSIAAPTLAIAGYNAGEGAIGLIQWEGPRRVALENYAHQQGRPVTDWKLQVDFMMHELQTSESGAWAKIQRAQTPGEVAAAFDKYYERSAGTSRGERVANAENIHRTIATDNSNVA